MTTALINQPSMRQRWQDDLKKLMTDIKQWASSAGWKVDSIQREIEEVSIGLYSAEELIINISANKRIHIEVMGRGDEYSPGKVEMFAWPTLIRVLFFKKDEWQRSIAWRLMCVIRSA